jgi:hypothetical protein
MDNMEKLVMIYKYWSNDARLNCNNIVEGFAKRNFEVKDFLLDDNEQDFKEVRVYENE